MKHSTLQTTIFKFITLLLAIYFVTTYKYSYAEVSGTLVTPTRIVIPSNSKSASLTLTNTSNNEASYRLNLIEMGLDSNGNYRELNKNELHPQQRSAQPIIRFSPKQLRLKPGASQVVRVIARRGRLSQGEYRSHMVLRALPVLSGLEIANDDGKSPVLIESSSEVNVGVSIPVIIRHGNTSTSVSLKKSTILFDQSGKRGMINMTMGLDGNRSAYGDISISLVNGKKEKIIAKLNSFALYYPYPTENVGIRLRDNVSRSEFTSSSRIRVRFENKSIDSSNEYWMDEVAIPEVR